MPAVRCTTIVTVSAVIVPVLARLTRVSLYQGGLPPTDGVTVTPPFPPPPPVTVRATIVVRVSAGVPPVPLMVTFTGPPVAAVAAAVKVTTLLLPVVGSGLNEAVTPEGSPLALRSTEAVKAVRVMAIVLVAVEPWVTPTAGGEADSVKFEDTDGFTVSATVVVRVSAGVPPVPLMVTFTGPPVTAV